MYAEVIVDVNIIVSIKVFTIDSWKFKECNLIGYRVEVPFGTRVVQGYVVNISKKYNGEYDKNNFKSIKKLKRWFSNFN